ncbi:MAG: hypothetical protein GF390_04215 [Candidatus Pacebacteria bacterium]|nr:hypothetical protein [Candidatus Paceibacterota bacterium]
MPKRRRRTSKSGQSLPKPPSLWQTIGPSFILLGLALGSGELILWPYLAANYGLGLLWGGLLGISFQYVLNTETMRYSLAWGESVFVGFRKLCWLIPVWYIISTFIPWSLPGFSSAAAQILFDFLGNAGLPIAAALGEKIVAVFLLLLTGTILTAGQVLYKTMEYLQKTIILLGLPLIAILTVILTQQSDWIEAGWGLLGRGQGWWLFPPNIALASFLGAFAYAGAGGNLNLAQSYYIKEKGFGMGKFAAKITSLFAGGNKPVKITGQSFKDTSKNQRLWQQWWRLVNLEHFLVFWVLGFVTIVLLAVLAKSLVFGQGVESGLSFLYAEAAVIGQQTWPLLRIVFLLIAALMLFSTQLGVLESSSRIISENVLLLFHRQGGRYNLSLGFYLALWAQIGLGIVVYLFGWQEPRFLLTLSAVLNAAAMMVSFPLVYLLNRQLLPARYQPRLWRKLVMLAAFLFFVYFVGVTFKGAFS